MSNIEKMHKRMQKLGGKSVKVGVMDGQYPDGTSVVDVAIFHEFGTKKMPPRPFMRQTEEGAKNELKRVQAHLIRKVQLGEITVEQAQEALGQWYQSQVQAEITNGDFEVNAAQTIAKKGSSKPLIDTGQLRNSIRYKKI